MASYYTKYYYLYIKVPQKNHKPFQDFLGPYRVKNYLKNTTIDFFYLVKKGSLSQRNWFTVHLDHLK